MPWFKVDDGFSTSRKVIQIPRRDRFQAIGLWLMAGNFAAKELTDGHIPAYVLDEIGAPEELVDLLISVGLWDCDEQGEIWFHDWCEYQPSASEYREKRREVSEKRTEAANKRWSNAKSIQEDANAMQTVCKTDANEMQTVCPEPEPEPSITKVIDINHQGNFDEFWEFYPRKVGKGASQQALSKALKQATWQEILAGVRRLSADPNLPEKQFIPHPATWLNEGRWADEPYAPRGKTNQREAQREQASAKFLASFSQQPELTANPDWA
jgi:hypothetical protein